MRKSLKALFILCALALAVAGCKSSSDDDDTTISAPSMGTAADIPTSGATSAPSTGSDAAALYTAATGALSAAMSSLSPSIRSVRALARGAARATENDYQDLAGSYTVGTGTVTLTGGLTSSFTSPDQGWEPTANTTYNDLINVTMVGDVTGTISKATASSGGHTYTINGKLVNRENISFNIDLATTDSDYTANLDYALSLGLGYALSVVREDGVGAKFILSYAANYANGDISLSDWSTYEAKYQTELEDYLLSQPVTLSVYDDNNVLLYTAELDANTAFEDSVF